MAPVPSSYISPSAASTRQRGRIHKHGQARFAQLPAMLWTKDQQSTAVKLCVGLRPDNIESPAAKWASD